MMSECCARQVAGAVGVAVAVAVVVVVVVGGCAACTAPSGGC